MKNTIICINRKYGSGGSIIGARVAEKLGIKCYDNNLLNMAIEYGGLDESKISDKLIVKSEEKAPRKYTYMLFDTGNEHVEKESPAADIIFDLEKQLIEKAAEEADCVVIGRCAGEILEKAGFNVLKVFITAPYEDRVDHIFENSDEYITEKVAESQIAAVEKGRTRFFENYTGKKWDAPESYDIVLNTSSIGMDRVVNLLCSIYEHMKENQ